MGAELEWFNPKNAAATYDGAWKKMQDYLDWHIDAANKMGKPVVLEEFGINRDDGSFRPSARPRCIATGSTVDLRVDRAARRGGRRHRRLQLLGVGRRGPHANADFMWKAGDSFVGDPPQEPQGLYCVFDSDTSTIEDHLGARAQADVR